MSATTAPPVRSWTTEHGRKERVALIDEVVAEHDDERGVADVRGRSRHGVPEPRGSP
jgi:hypothetical protein